jgi:mannose-6-phosphate isomerase-like protein (cupin superfamily)
MMEIGMAMEPAIARSPDLYETYRIAPADTNRMALIADPIRDGVPFTAIVEIFDVGGKTPPNTHSEAFEMFYVLSGKGVAYCNGEAFPVAPGDSFVVRPGYEHIVENTGTERLYCITVMMPNEGFAELIRKGISMPLDVADLAALRGQAPPHEISFSKEKAAISRSKVMKPSA